MMGADPGRAGGRRLRCAIYTRKSTENGLEQEFNSLDNQREAAEAYIKSQAHEGWRPLAEAYDDGGYSGGSLERPALQRLLAEVRSGRVDVIVVYKVDRLTRSLSDFAKLVDLFDRHGVSFVSVTQAFNTTNSMGRLTLNVLLSFAQFEREVTAERIRDKIAASKKKGIRVGGPVPLGYVSQDKKLVPDPGEAEQVRGIFARYLELRCLNALVADLRQRGTRTKLTRRRDGSQRGGLAFGNASLAHLLHNRVYVGEIIHKDRHYPGEHTGIVPVELFEAVQAALSEKAPEQRIDRIRAAAPLTGLLFDAHGREMLPNTARKAALRYRYYVSRPHSHEHTPVQGSTGLSSGSKPASHALPITRVAAPELERAVLGALGIGDEGIIDPQAAASTIAARLRRVVLHPDRLVLRLRRSDQANDRNESETDDEVESRPGCSLTIPWSAKAGRKRREIIRLPDERGEAPRMRSETRARLLEGIAKARNWLDDLLTGRVADTAAIAKHEGCSERSVRMVLNLAFLSPSLVQAAIAGTLPEAMGITALTAAPMAWGRQTHTGDPVRLH